MRDGRFQGVKDDKKHVENYAVGLKTVANARCVAAYHCYQAVVQKVHLEFSAQVHYFAVKQASSDAAHPAHDAVMSGTRRAAAKQNFRRYAQNAPHYTIQKLHRPEAQCVHPVAEKLR